MEALFGHTVIPLNDLLWRFGLACAFGFLLGLDRELRGISAGIRTHVLVALSSAMTMLIALEFYESISKLHPGMPSGLDPTRAIQGLAQAIGFLCAGVIFVSRGSVYGVTTAASLWMTSSIGMAAGAGMFEIAAIGLMFALFVITVLRLFRAIVPQPRSETERAYEAEAMNRQENTTDAKGHVSHRIES